MLAKFIAFLSEFMRLLLINPKAPESFWNFRWGIQAILPHKRAVNPPLGLATRAALCPPHWQVTIVDENIESLPLAAAADLIGIAGMGVQFARQSELLRYYRGRGYPVVAGGSFASLCPERYSDLADTIICGEAEYIWPRFCRDFERQQALPLYRGTGTVDLNHSPVPRFDLLKLKMYTTATLQFSRGCPYLCEFCDIIVMFGRRPRHKAPEQIGRELDRLRESGIRNVFFVNDNLIGNRPKAEDLLRFLIDYQTRRRYAFGFGTEASLNLAKDPELMSLLREANFSWVFIGIESSDEKSLRETRKLQNLGEHPLDAVRRIYSYGIDVLAGFIVGYKRLYNRLLTDAAIARRIINKHRFLRRPAYRAQYGLIAGTRIVARLLGRGVFPGGPWIYHFARSLPWRAPRNIPLAIADWITSLSLRDYVQRHFGDLALAPPPTWHARLARLTTAIAQYAGEAKLALSQQIDGTGAPVLTLSLNAWRNERLFARVSRQLCALLVDTPSRLKLRIEAIGRADLPHVRRLLRQLAKFGDRVSIEIDETFHDLIALEVWGFELALPRAPNAYRSE